MNKIALTLFFILLSLQTYSQIDTLLFIKKDGNNSTIINAASDKFNNIYILTYYKYPVVTLPKGQATDGIVENEKSITLTKINHLGKLLWTQHYLTKYGRSLFEITPAQNIYYFNDKLYIPFSTGSGKLDLGNYYPYHFSRNACLIVNAKNGNTIQKSIFNDNNEPIYDELIQTLCLPPFQLLYFYQINNQHIASKEIHINYRDAQLHSNADRLIPFPSTPPFVNYDTYTHQYITMQKEGLIFYDTQWHKNHTIALQPPYQLKTITNYKLSFNKNYYLINYGGINDSNQQKNYTLIYTKNGTIKSAKNTNYTDAILTNINKIWCISNDTTKSTPIQIQQLDLFQNIIKTKAIGHQNYQAQIITTDTKNNPTIIGTAISNDNLKQKFNKGIYIYSITQNKFLQLKKIKNK